MILTDQQRTAFEEATRPLIQWLNENCHPHVTAIVDCTNAELMEGVCLFRTEDYHKD